MRKYLSIGEVAKIKGVSHRMLRHYDKIGILKPIYINDENGYRYYSKNQMIVLDLILTCTYLGIPLKQFHKYIHDGYFDIEQIVTDGNELAVKKMKEINDTVYLLQSIKEHINNESSTYTGCYKKHFDKRYFLTVEVTTANYNINDYWENVSILYFKIKELDLTLSINQGTCVIYSGGSYKLLTFIEVLKPDFDVPNLLEIPDGIYHCEMFSDDDFEQAKQKYLKPYPDGSVLIMADVFEKNIGMQIPPFEMQLFKNI